MVDVTSKIIIAAPADKVSAYTADPDNAPKWYKNIKSVEWLPAGQSGKTPKPLIVGSRVAFKANFLGKELTYIYEIKEYVPGQHLVMSTFEGPFPMETTYRWQRIDDNTCSMTLRNAGKPAGFSKLFAPFMEMAMRSANKKDLKLLKHILEK
ncbi:MAG: SRPBCC family protein [Ginsengibacter sp.]